MHARSLFPADHLHHFVEAHIAAIHQVGLPLAHRGDAIADFQSAIHLRRPAGHEALNLGVTVFRPEHGPDAHERQSHVDAEILQIRFAQIFRVRIVGLGQGVEVKFDLLVPVLFMHVARETLVAAGHQLRPGLDGMFAQLFLQ